MTDINSIFNAVFTDENAKKYSNIECELKLLLLGKHKDVKQIFNSKNDIQAFVKCLIDTFCPTSSCVISETIDFIYEVSASQKKIKTLVFKNGVQQKDAKRFMLKSKLIDKSIFVLNDDYSQIPYKININGETLMDELNPSIQEKNPPNSGKNPPNSGKNPPNSAEKALIVDDAQPSRARAKLRLSIFAKDKKSQLGNWQIDITLVKTVVKPNNVSELKNIRDNLFGNKVDVNGFYVNAPWDFADDVEIEIEWIGKKLSIADLKIVDQIAQKCLSDEVKSSRGESKSSGDLELFVKTVGQNRRNIYRGIKSLWNNALDIDKSLFMSEVKEDIIKGSYYLTDKIDGVRAIMIINNGNASFLTTGGTALPKVNLTKNAGTDLHMADVEIYGDTIYVIHPIFTNGLNLAMTSFAEALKHITHFENLASNIKAKKYILLKGEDYGKDLLKYHKEIPRKLYETDGLILTEANAPSYIKTKNYKWKPIENTTIDFLLRECPKENLGINPYIVKPKHKLYILFVGINRCVREFLGIPYVPFYKKLFYAIPHTQEYIPIQFAPSNNVYAHMFNYNGKLDLDGKICEMIYDISSSEWKLYKVREDKEALAQSNTYFGNNFSVAEGIWFSYFNPLTLNCLAGKIEDESYFQQHDVPAYRAMRKYMNYVKARLLIPYSGSEYVVDLGSGKGQDIRKYRNAEIKNLICVETDKDAIQELNKRKFEEKQSMMCDESGKAKSTMRVFTIQADLNKSTDTVYEEIKHTGEFPTNGASLVVCNLAFHYLTETKAQIDNILGFINDIVSPTGTFYYTAFSGEKVFDLLNKHNGKWEVVDKDGTIKYSIMFKDHVNGKANKQKKLDSYGVKIKVLLPFSNEHREETLINDSFIEKCFARIKMEKELCESFDTMLDIYKKEQPQAFNNLSDADKEWISLYQYVSYKRKKETKKIERRGGRFAKAKSNIKLEEAEDVEITDEMKS
jgi:hypothetical protein